MSLVGGNACLMTGILSPVSIASFMMHCPLSKIISHGIRQFSGISTISPGTNSKLYT